MGLWVFLDRNWLIIQNKYNRRTENKDIYDIKNFKDELKNTVGFTTVFFFCRFYIPIENIQVLIREIDKELILLYYIVCGEPGSKMSHLMKYTTFYKLYKKFWSNDKNYECLMFI